MAWTQSQPARSPFPVAHGAAPPGGPAVSLGLTLRLSVTPRQAASEKQNARMHQAVNMWLRTLRYSLSQDCCLGFQNLHGLKEGKGRGARPWVAGVHDAAVVMPPLHRIPSLSHKGVLLISL